MLKRIIAILLFFVLTITLTSCVSVNPNSITWYLLSYTIKDKTYYVNEHNQLDHFGGVHEEDSTIEFNDFGKLTFKPLNGDAISGTYRVGAKTLTLKINSTKIIGTCIENTATKAILLKFTYAEVDYVFHCDAGYHLLNASDENYISYVSTLYYNSIFMQIHQHFDNSNIIHYGEIVYQDDSYYFICNAKDQNCNFEHKFTSYDNIFVYIISDSKKITIYNEIKIGNAACAFDSYTVTNENGFSPHTFSICYYD